MSQSHPVATRRAESCDLRIDAIFGSLLLPTAFLCEDGAIVNVNAAMETLLSRDCSELENASLLDLVHPEDSVVLEDHLRELTAGWTDGFNLDLRFLTEDTQFAWCRVWCALDPGPAQPRVVLVAGDLTHTKHSEAMLQHLSYFDELTGLPNRTLAKEHLMQQIADGSIRHIAVMLLDLDRFQLINDTHGHDVGDQILREIAGRLAIDPDLMPCRLGGDEFLLIARNCDRATAEAHAAEILQRIGEPVPTGQRPLYVRASMGIAIWPEDDRTVTGLLRSADIAMNRAKQRERGHYCFFTRAMDEKLSHQLNLETDLRHAAERGELTLHFQPQVSCRSGAIVGAEALMRWNHPTLGWLSPGEFIPIAEVSGAIHQLGDWTLRHASEAVRRIHDLGFPRFRIAINLSPTMFYGRDLLGAMKGTISQAEIDPEGLEVEITEGTMMAMETESAAVLAGLKELGVSLAVDDFGTGYSSLGYLKRFPIDVLKIDRSFVSDIGSDVNGEEIARLIIRMTHALGARVVAEGVETAGQLEFLAEEGCDEFQGYLFSPAVPIDELERMVVEGRSIADVLSGQ